MNVDTAACFGTTVSSAAECASWVQAWAGIAQALGALLALGVAVCVPLLQAARARSEARRGHFQAIAIDIEFAERVAATYLSDRIMAPAYRLPLAGEKVAFPALMAEGVLRLDDATAIADFYMHADSFNRSLDLTQEAAISGQGLAAQARRARIKAQGLQRGHKVRRIERALSALSSGLPGEQHPQLAQLTPDSEDVAPTPIRAVAPRGLRKR